MEITTERLLAMPSGIVFYEVDLPAMSLFQKVGNSDNDVVVLTIADKDEEQLRLGLREMDEVDRNSKRWHVCEPNELERMIVRLSEGAFASGAILNTTI
jgi:hypothetical protein